MGESMGQSQNAWHRDRFKRDQTFVTQVVNKNMDIKKTKDMIRNLILMSSEPGDDTRCYFKVTPGKIKKKNGESKEKIENCVHLFTKLNTHQKIIRTNDYLQNYSGKSYFMWTASELICSPNCCLCIISEFTINFYFRKSVSGQEMELNRVA